jgi:hypothetical protein
VAEIKAEVDHPVLLLDSGDTLQGTPLEEYVHVRFGEPSPVIEAMNFLGYDAMALGNHDFNFGLDVLNRARELADFPFLSANTVDVETGEPAFPPFVVRELAGVRVGILGLVTSNIPGWEDPANYQGLRFESMDEAAGRWVRVLREDEGCDLVVVLAHTGFEIDLETGESDGTEYENFGNRLQDVEGIDVLLTGHAHDNIPPREVKGVIVSQPMSRGRRLTRIDLELESGLQPVSCEPFEIEQIVLRLLESAAAAGEDEGEVLVSLCAGDEGLELVVMDGGRAIDPEVVEHIFDPFDSEVAIQSERGRGLRDCYRIIQDYEGELRVASGDGGGTRVTVVLPASLVVGNAPAAPPDADR